MALYEFTRRHGYQECPVRQLPWQLWLGSWSGTLWNGLHRPLWNGLHGPLWNGLHAAWTIVTCDKCSVHICWMIHAVMDHCRIISGSEMILWDDLCSSGWSSMKDDIGWDIYPSILLRQDYNKRLYSLIWIVSRQPTVVSLSGHRINPFIGVTTECRKFKVYLYPWCVPFVKVVNTKTGFGVQFEGHTMFVGFRTTCSIFTLCHIYLSLYLYSVAFI